MTEETTPENVTTEETSAAVSDAGTANVDNAPETNGAEPEAENKTAANTDTTEPEKLLAGKYKTVDELEKGYKEAQKFVTKAAEYEKQLKAYKEAEEKAREQREIAARRQGYNDADEREFQFDIKNFEFQNYVQALETTLSGDVYTRAYNALLRYQNTGNPQDLAVARSCFTPDTVAKIAKKTALYEQSRSNDYLERKNLQRLSAARNNLETFAKETEGWLTPKERQDIVGLAVNLTGGDVDLRALKTLVDAAEKAAVDRYIAEQKAISENKQVQDSLQTPTGGGNVVSGEKWVTREDYNAMSDAEFDRQRDKIERQILLEKSGKLPRMLT